MISAAVLDKILGLLAPLFLDVAAPDTGTARRAAQSMLASYEARTNRELRTAALAIAFSFGALDALGRSADPDLPVNQVLRLRGNANALNRAAEQNENRLERLLGRPALEPAEATPEPELPAAGATDDLVAFVRSTWKAEKAAAQPASPSRQQQRFADRRAEKQQQREQEQTRLTERAAQRDAAYAERSRRTA